MNTLYGNGNSSEKDRNGCEQLMDERECLMQKRKELLEKIEELSTIVGKKYFTLRQSGKLYGDANGSEWDETVKASTDIDELTVEFHQLDQRCKAIELELEL